MRLGTWLLVLACAAMTTNVRATGSPLTFACRIYQPDTQAQTIRPLVVDLDHRQVDGHFATIKGDRVSWHERTATDLISFRMDLASGEMLIGRRPKAPTHSAPGPVAIGSCQPSGS